MSTTSAKSEKNSETVGQQLCLAVKEYPCIFDPNCEDFFNKAVRETAWQQISSGLGISLPALKSKWFHIRQAFLRQNNVIPQSNSRKKSSKPKEDLSAYLEFLKPFLDNPSVESEKTLTNESPSDDVVSTTEITENQPTKGDENVIKTTEKSKKRSNSETVDDNDSDTTSADEVVIAALANNGQATEVTDIINLDDDENSKPIVQDENLANNEETPEDENLNRSRYKRACKRGLDEESLLELTTSPTREQEEKRPKRSAERRKSLAHIALEHFEKKRKSSSTSSAKSTDPRLGKSRQRKSVTPQNLEQHNNIANECGDYADSVHLTNSDNVKEKQFSNNSNNNYGNSYNGNANITPINNYQRNGNNNSNFSDHRNNGNDASSSSSYSADIYNQRAFLHASMDHFNNSYQISQSEQFLTPKNYNEQKPKSKSPLLLDNFTQTQMRNAECSVQTDVEPTRLDNEFLESIRPQLDLMNARQKLNFKRKVFQALMEVFDDASNFPNNTDIISLPSQGAPRFDTTSSGELRLMRELVSLVQAAKTTPEIINATEKVTPNKMPAPIRVPTPNRPLSIPNKVATNAKEVITSRTVDADNHTPETNRQQTSTVILNTSGADDNLVGVPRHVIRKVVKVSGTNGGTILAHDGDKRRIYRIYPRGTGSSATPTTTATPTVAKSSGTFYIAPPKSSAGPIILNRSINLTSQSTTTTTSATSTSSSPQLFNAAPKVVSVNKTAIPAIGVRTAPTSMLPPSIRSQAANGTLNVRSFVRSNTAVGHNNLKVMQRRYSICGPPLGRNGTQAPTQQQTQVYSRKSSPPPPSTIITKRYYTSHTDNKNSPSPPSPLSSIQISQPVSLNPVATNANANAEANTDPATYLDEVTGQVTSSSGSNPSPPPTPADNIMVLQTAATIAADSYDPLALKPFIKTEPTE